jgi:malate dehydrogenase (oxaloacetate-decarboxylating)
VVILGAGAAGIGIARLVRDALKRQGVKGEELIEAVAVLDSRGLLVDDAEVRDAYKREFTWPAALAARLGLPLGARALEAVVNAVAPTVLIGTSGEPGTFGESVVRAMAARVPRPLILPLSNPTSQSEAQPAHLLAWTEGRALVATGSPFEDVTYGGRSRRIGQANNAFVFPGVGLGALVAEAREVTQGMFEAAADCLAGEVSDDDLASGALFPRIRELRRVTAKVAVAVVRAARDAGVGRSLEAAEIPAAVAAAMWEPRYVPLVPAPVEQPMSLGAPR